MVIRTTTMMINDNEKIRRRRKKKRIRNSKLCPTPSCIRVFDQGNNCATQGIILLKCSPNGSQGNGTRN